MSCGVGRRCGSDPELLWLWCRLVATAQIGSLALEPPYAEGAALEKTKRLALSLSIYIFMSTCLLTGTSGSLFLCLPSLVLVHELCPISHHPKELGDVRGKPKALGPSRVAGPCC